jgi:hypothetical protein
VEIDDDEDTALLATRNELRDINCSAFFFLFLLPVERPRFPLLVK